MNRSNVGLSSLRGNLNKTVKERKRLNKVWEKTYERESFTWVDNRNWEKCVMISRKLPWSGDATYYNLKLSLSLSNYFSDSNQHCVSSVLLRIICIWVKELITYFIGECSIFLTQLFFIFLSKNWKQSRYFRKATRFSSY